MKKIKFEEMISKVEGTKSTHMLSLLKVHNRLLVEVLDKKKKSTGFALIDTKRKIMVIPPMAQSNIKNQLNRILGEVVDATDFPQMIKDSILIKDVTTNPFLSSGFIQQSVMEELPIWNNIVPSIYHEKLEAIRGDDDIDLLLKLIRTADENRMTQYNLSFFEIAISWQIFHHSKIMAILINYAKGQGLGKTTLFTLGGYLYDTSNDTDFHSLINAGDEKATEWGDELEGRTVIFDDIPKTRSVVQKIAIVMKSYATSVKDVKLNIKGQGKKTSNAFNVGGTTNEIEGIPVDGSKEDRRVYPLELKEEDITREEKRAIVDLSFPMHGDTSRYFPLIQKYLNHFKWVYEETKDDKVIRDFLMKEVPNSSFKREVIKARMTDSLTFLSMVSSCTSMTQLLENLSSYFEDANFSFLADPKSVLIDPTKQGYFNMYLKADALKTLSIILSDGEYRLTAQKTAKKYFRSQTYKSYKVKGKLVRSIRVTMMNFKPLEPMGETNVPEILDSLAQTGLWEQDTRQ